MARCCLSVARFLRKPQSFRVRSKRCFSGQTVDAKEVAKRIKECDAMYILAGAGMGVDSGLPDFRSNDGFWNAYPPMKKMGVGFQDMANPQWFETDPGLAWAFYGHRLAMYRRTEPHRGYQYLLEMAQSMAKSYWVFTSNVDGHFAKAGFDDRRIFECHGSIHYLQCTNHCFKHDDDLFPNGIASLRELEERGLKPISDEVLNTTSELQRASKEKIPGCLCRITGKGQCPHGQSQHSRPNILMFNDGGFIPNRTVAQNIELNNYFDNELEIKQKWRKGKEVTDKVAVIEIGAGNAVPTVRYEAENKALRCGHVFVRINRHPDDCKVNRVTKCPPHVFGIHGSALSTLKDIYNEWETL